MLIEHNLALNFNLDIDIDIDIDIDKFELNNITTR